MSQAVHVIIVGGTDADRRRVYKVAQLLRDESEWETEPPSIGAIQSHEFYADAKYALCQLQIEDATGDIETGEIR